MVLGGDIELGMELNLYPMNKAPKAKVHSQLPQGFIFHPADEELITYILTKKILDNTFYGHAIAEADLNKCEPWDLMGTSV